MIPVLSFIGTYHKLDNPLDLVHAGHRLVQFARLLPVGPQVEDYVWALKLAFYSDPRVSVLQQTDVS